ncbi:hypothetical protein I79_016556 [Cricetulus griseus]|uniref:Uncharacterized protein n=1 Tax=Cricetulus griseus TaxID=10029 RepID=G3HZP9_CRIGR|nr:hypothetical protein I79_016556 [Cricetulus griseus]
MEYVRGHPRAERTPGEVAAGCGLGTGAPVDSASGWRAHYVTLSCQPAPSPRTEQNWTVRAAAGVLLNFCLLWNVDLGE